MSIELDNASVQPEAEIAPASTATPRRYRPEETKMRVLAAAADLFGRKSYDRCSTADIASVAGVAEGSIFYHFGSKRGLLAALGRQYSERMIAAMRGDHVSLVGLDTATMISRCFDFCAVHGKGLELVGLDECSPEAEPYFSAGRQVVVEFVEQSILANIDHSAVSDMDVPLAASLAFAAVHDSLHRLQQTTEMRDIDRIKRETIRFVTAACGI
jgi:AcrR family transcriptional regulator